MVIVLDNNIIEHNYIVTRILIYAQAQYIDIYDSVLEHVVCGETKIDAVNLRVDLKRLRTVDQNSGQTELEKQFQV